MKTVQISTITGVPGVESIIVEPDGDLFQGVRVRLVTDLHVDRDQDGQSYGLEELNEYIVALQTAQALAQDLAHAIERGMSAPPTMAGVREPRVWEKVDDIPGDVKIIIDSDLDAYFRVGEGWAAGPGKDPFTVIENFAPFTEVIL
jgi:hypothetical protein